MHRYRNVHLGLLLLLLGSLELATSNAVPNPQPDPRITPPPAPPTPAKGIFDQSLVKRQTFEQICGKNYNPCDLTYCCPSTKYCIPDFITDTLTWTCQDLSQLRSSLDQYSSSIHALLSSWTAAGYFGTGFDYGSWYSDFYGSTRGAKASSSSRFSSSDSSTSSTTSQSSTSGLSTGAIIGIALGGVILILIVVIGILLCKRQRSRKRTTNPEPSKLINYASEPNKPLYKPQPTPQLMQQQNLAAPGYYADPSNQPFLQGQQPYSQSASPQLLPQYQQHDPSPYPYGVPAQPILNYYPVPEGVVEAGGGEVNIASTNTGTGRNNPIHSVSPAPSAQLEANTTPHAQGTVRLQGEQVMYEMDSGARK